MNTLHFATYCTYMHVRMSIYIVIKTIAVINKIFIKNKIHTYTQTLHIFYVSRKITFIICIYIYVFIYIYMYIHIRNVETVSVSIDRSVGTVI